MDCKKLKNKNTCCCCSCNCCSCDWDSEEGLYDSSYEIPEDESILETIIDEFLKKIGIDTVDKILMLQLAFYILFGVVAFIIAYNIF